jgi:UDP-2,4-diacetamido-2,4,6-trideoxy-beta-L-altropyranose hydrolase
MMKVAILTEGGKKRGFGHITRCLSFYQALEAKGIFSEMVVNGDPSVEKFLEGEKHRILNWLKNRDELFELIGGSDSVIIDSYRAPITFYQKVSEIVKYPVYLDDTQRVNYPRGLVVNGAIGAEKLRYPKKEGVTYLLGIQYAPLRREFIDVPRKKLRKKVENLMITFGGNDRNVTPKVLRLLMRNYPEIDRKVIIGRGYRNTKEIESLKNYRTELIYFPEGKEMKQVMFDVDFAISGGGQTLYELARVGVPTVAVGISENQIHNLGGWEKVGFLRFAGWLGDKNLLSNLSRRIDELLPYEVRRLKSRMGRITIDGKGVERIIDKIPGVSGAKGMIRLRDVIENDCHDLWMWRNHPDVRKWSFNDKEIDYQGHVRWFQEKLRTKTEKLYIAESEYSEKVGHVRFQMNSDHSAYASINLNPRYFSRSLGNRILRKASLQFLKEYERVKEIKAEILDGNTVSKKAFLKAGYIYSEHSTRNGKSIAIYRLKRV